jgi:hypothetical protein
MALSARELRVGNLLQGYNKIRTVAELHKEYYTDTDGVSTFYRDADGIELTEEWLLKLDFMPHTTKSNPGEFTLYYKDEFTYNPCSGWWIFGKNIKEKVKLEYIHQLQNLYFALTGNELTIK